MGKKRPIDKCKLCGELKPLCKSHIIPKFFQREIDYLDEKGRMALIKTEPYNEHKIQDGFKEYLLCEECEKFLNENYEKPFKKYWIDEKCIPEKVYGTEIELTNYDYSVFKLFHLSIIWRASISNLPEYEEVSLGPYEEKLRKMLVNREAGDETNYMIFGYLLKDENSKLANGVLSNFCRDRILGANSYLGIYGGCEWYFVMSDRPTVELSHHVDAFHRRIPKIDGKMTLRVKSVSDSSAIKNAALSKRKVSDKVKS